MDSDPGAVPRNFVAAKADERRAIQRAESGNDDKPALMDPETKRRAHALIREFLDWQAEETAAKEKAADDEKWAKTRKMIGATDTLPGEIPTNASHQQLKDSIARLKKRELKQVIDRRQAAAGTTGGRAVDTAPVKKRTQQQPSSLRLRATPAFSERSFKEVPKRGFNLGQTQEQINAANDEANRRMGAKMRGEDVEPAASAELGEYTAEINSSDVNVSFAAQVKKEGARQRAAAMTPPKPNGLQYCDPYENYQTFEAAGAKMRVGQDSAIDWTTKRFEIETAAMREKLGGN